MSKSKRGGGADHLYSAFGYDGFANNAQRRREQIIQAMLQRVISELAMNRFKWQGLPESIDPRFLETILFRQALAVYYKDSVYDKELVVKGSGVGWINVFDNPISFNVISPGLEIDVNGARSNVQSSRLLNAFDRMRHLDWPKEKQQEMAIPIWANYTRVPDWDIVQIYSSRLATMDTTIEINTRNARRNRVLKGTPNTQLSVQNAVRGFDQGDNLEMLTGPLEDLTFMDTVDLGITPDAYEKLHILRTRTWNECMGLLGINNANQDKKERLVAAEVSANDEQTDSMRNVALNARRQAAELISNVFDHEITVEYNTEVEAQAKAKEQAQLENQSQPEPVNKGTE